MWRTKSTEKRLIKREEVKKFKMSYYKSDYLYHHGILGQRWGKRNGPPYPLDAQDHSASEKKAGWKKSLEKDERRSDNTQSPKNTTSDETPKKKWSTKKKVAVGAAATVAALAAIGGMYVYKKMYGFPIHVGYVPSVKSPIDFSKLSDREITLKQGSVIKRISTKKFEDYASEGKTIYASYLRKDAQLYKEKMPTFFAEYNAKEYEHKIRLKRDVKVASRKVAAEIYAELFGNSAGNYYRLTEGLMNRDHPDVQKYLTELRRRGYDAIIDENDVGWSKSPLIILNPKEVIASSRSHKVGHVERIINTLLF